MKYWLKHPGGGHFLGPSSLDEIRQELEQGRLTWQYQATEAQGQSLGKLRECQTWQPLQTIFDPSSITMPTVTETWPPSDEYGNAAEKFLAGIQCDTAYPKVRKGVEIIEWILFSGLLLLLTLIILFGGSPQGKLTEVVNLLIYCVVVLCVFYFIKHILLALLDIADLMIRRNIDRE